MDKLTPFLSAEKIAALNQQLAQRINTDYSKVLAKDEALWIIVTLKGALFFAADLVRLIEHPVYVDYVRLASYGSGTESTGQVRFLKDIEKSPQGQHLLVLDEIVDSGNTLAFLEERLQAQGPKSVKFATLLSKPSRRKVQVKVDYIGLEVEDKFLVGYGLDFAEKYRSLKDIYVVG